MQIDSELGKPGGVKMALLTSCCCFSLLVGAIASGVYATLMYLVAFGMELWWLIEAEDGLPAPAYFLCLGYLCIFFVSITLLGGLAGRRMNVLLAWLFVMVLFLFPECGMVLFMSLYHWKLDSHYGLAELVFYVCRAALNVLAIISVQSLYATWREEKLVLKRLRELTIAFAAPNKLLPRVQDVERNGKINGSTNHGYYSSVDQMNGGMLVEAGIPKIPR
ncbi:unnamed protein product [Notodromas monacha]|uniref:Uncharacterized protein n=1 Tax=Notodromas monacha TaxID=399045 RepID=A0A7R9BFC7_9CRUS|nr:unnamed protein product [Notodromas monacha]CAG0913467.1 unnamed protein product [Notodromas monacha]